MEISLYWGVEYTKVLLGYVFLMFIWPSVIFRRYLKGKALVFRFSFCAVLQPVLINTAVLMLGLVHVLTPWILRILFYGALFWSLFRNVRIGKEEIGRIRCLMTGTFGVKQFFYRIFSWLRKKLAQALRSLGRRLYSHWWECALLGILVVFGMIYFTYGAFQDHIYGFGDMYPHNSWTYELTNGNIFSAGVYPEGMHCFLCALHVLFGIRIYSCLLFLAGIHSAVYLISAYVFLRQVFRWRYAPMLTLAAFLTVDLLCIDEVYSMSRLQWSLPQEFGLYAMFLCGAFLIRYARSEKRLMRKRKGKLSKYYWDENLLIFMLALAATLAIHFYVTIMAFFLCLSFVPVMLKRVLCRKRFFPLAAAVICGFTIAVVPMGGALLSGIPFQGSIGWAMNVMNGTDPEQAANRVGQENTETVRPDGAAGTNPADGAGSGNTAQGSEGELNSQGSAPEQEISGQETPQAPAPTQPPLAERLKGRLMGLWNRALEYGDIMVKGVWKYCYVTLYQTERAMWLIGFLGLAVCIWLAYRLPAMFLNLFLKKRKIPAGFFDHYFSVALASFLFMFLYNSSYLNLPQLIAGSRLCSTAQMLNLAMMTVPFDLIFFCLGSILPSAVMKLLAALCVGGIYAGTILTGTFHGFLYFEFSRYNEAVEATVSISQQLPANSYTIVSPVDELYQVIQFGFHEELVNFVNSVREEDYTLPSQYIFIFVEKKPLQYGQSHFFTGPSWLGCEKYADYYHSFVSQCPEVASSEISPEYAADPRMWFPVQSNMYSNLEIRTVLESRAYEWCQKFDKLYPNELKVYCGTDRFICYYFEQNVQRLYQLGGLYRDGVD